MNKEKIFKVVKSGEIVRPGDSISIKSDNMIFKGELNDIIIPILESMGILVEYTDSSEDTMCIGDVIVHLANRINWKPENLGKYLDTLETINPTAAFSVLLKELALMLDEKYPGHIKNSNEIWSISLVNGNPIKIDSPIFNFNNFAAFRSYEDAMLAKSIFKTVLDDLFRK